MHIAWTRHLLDNREFIVGGGTQPNTEPSRGEGLDGSATAEERDNYHRDAYENARNHASGPPAARGCWVSERIPGVDPPCTYTGKNPGSLHGRSRVFPGWYFCWGLYSKSAG